MSTMTRKLVLVGDGAVGKTSLLAVLVRGEFPIYYVPTVFENHVLDMEVKGELIKLTLQDTAAQGDYEQRLRPICYQGSHAFLLCFSIDRPDSLENILEVWDPEIKYFGAGNVPRFLVGCKKDLRHDQGTLQRLAQGSQVPVTSGHGKEIADKIGAAYLECSSKTGEGVREVFLQVTESMEAEKMIRFNHARKPNRLHSKRPWYGISGCIVA